MLRADLASSAVFALVDKAAFIERDLDIDAAAAFPDWTVAASRRRRWSSATSSSTANNNMTVQFRLYDVYGTGAAVCAAVHGADAARTGAALAHKVADDIYLAADRRQGYFDSRIVFVSKTPGDDRMPRPPRDHGPGRRQCRIPAVGLHAVMNPRFSPTDQLILYGAYVPDPRYPSATLLRTYLYDIETGRQEVLARRPSTHGLLGALLARWPFDRAEPRA